MPSVRVELTTFRLWDWRSNQLSQEGICPVDNFLTSDFEIFDEVFCN